MTRLLNWLARRRALWMTAIAALVLVSVVGILSAQDGVDWGDTPAWAALIVSLVSAAAAIHAARSSKAAVHVAEISAQASARQAAAAEEQVDIARRSLELAERQGHTGSLRDTLAEKPPYVAWWLDQRSKNTYVLRNIGTHTARNVEIDQSRIECAVRGTTMAKEVAPNSSIEMVLLPSFGAPEPNEIWVRWEGHPEWKAVPVP